tara:strand:- start:336 stop:1385 length:1050 start_codon:yes stop_codon:yes gene_type:complete
MDNKIAIFSDLHLGVHQNSDFWLGVSRKWTEWYIKQLKTNNIKTIIFCGDFFHYRDEISVKTLNFAKDLLDMFKDFKIIMITGNHDAWYKDTSEINSLSIFKGYNNVTIYDKLTTIDMNDKRVTFCPWGTNLNDIPESDILFGHFELENFRMNAYKICDHGDDPELLVDKASTIYSGHFHREDTKYYNNKKVKIVYVGNPFEMDFGDSGSRKGFYIYDFSTDQHEWVDNDISPQHIKIILSNLIKRNDKEVKYIFENILPGNIIKLIIDKNISTEHLDALTTKFLTCKPCELRIDYDVNYNKLKIESDEEYDLSGVDIKQAINDFVNMLDINNKKEVVDYTCSLFDTVK